MWEVGDRKKSCNVFFPLEKVSDNLTSRDTSAKAFFINSKNWLIWLLEKNALQSYKPILPNWLLFFCRILKCHGLMAIHWRKSQCSQVTKIEAKVFRALCLQWMPGKCNWMDTLKSYHRKHSLEKFLNFEQWW